MHPAFQASSAISRGTTVALFPAAASFVELSNLFFGILRAGATPHIGLDVCLYEGIESMAQLNQLLLCFWLMAKTRSHDAQRSDQRSNECRRAASCQNRVSVGDWLQEIIKRLGCAHCHWTSALESSFPGPVPDRIAETVLTRQRSDPTPPEVPSRSVHSR